MEEDDEWELCNDDGFVYKRKRRRLDPPPAEDTETSEAKLEIRRRERKKQTLLKLKEKYEKEIRDWDTLSNTLRSMQNAPFQQQQQQQQQSSSEQTQTQTQDPSSLASTSSTDPAGGSLLDELLMQVEAQEAIIHDISHLCDVAEAACFRREEQIKQSLFDLPIWASPLELMQVLCDDD